MRLSDFKTPGADLPGVHYLRNVEDADALLAAIAAVKQGGTHNAKVGRGQRVVGVAGRQRRGPAGAGAGAMGRARDRC